MIKKHLIVLVNCIFFAFFVNLKLYIKVVTIVIRLFFLLEFKKGTKYIDSDLVWRIQLMIIKG